MNPVTVTTNASVTTLKLATGHSGNKLDASQLGALRDLFSQLADDNPSCILLFGSGTFSEGRLGDVTDSVTGGIEAGVALTVSVFQEFSRIRAPKVAFVEGSALGLGANLAMHADVVVMSPSAVMGFPEIMNGFAPLLALSTLLRYVRPRDALWLVSTAESVDAVRAVELGMASELGDMSLARERAGWLANYRDSWSVAREFVMKHATEQPLDMVHSAEHAMVDELHRIHQSQSRAGSDLR